MRSWPSDSCKDVKSATSSRRSSSLRSCRVLAVSTYTKAKASAQEIAKMPEYQSVRRSARLGRGLLIGPEDMAHPAHGVDQGRSEARVHLFACVEGYSSDRRT